METGWETHSSEDLAGEKETILFVDDEHSLLDIAREYFGGRGYRLITAGNGAEALDVLSRETIDCCFTDINMPEMDGIELARAIRRIDNTIPVVVMTGFPSMDKSIDTLKNGVVDFLIKPVRLEAMEVCLQRVLRERRLFVDNLFLKKEVEKKKRLEALNRKLHERVEELQVFTRIMEDFTRISRSVDAFQRMADLAAEIARADGAWFFVANSAVPDPVPVAGNGKNGRDAPPLLRKRVADLAADGLDRARVLSGKGGGKAGEGAVGRPGGEGDDPADFDLLAVPLHIQGRLFGVLAVSAQNGRAPFSGKTCYYLNFLTQKAAYAVENLVLYENIYENLLSTLDALVQAIEAKDSYTRQHSRNVTDIALAIAEEMHCSAEDIDILKVAGPLHDIGKIGVPDDVLLKPSRLTPEEYEVIKTHAAKGAEIVGRLGLWEREQQIILHHHERYDGGGYPDGLAEKEIPLLARILSVADVFDAMASDRVYREKLPPESVAQAILNGAGTQFDPEVVTVFQRLFDADRLPGVGRSAAQAVA
ncbi:MAG: HD domain-containing phosphohydrolase [Desulfococcaceae bacterium]